MHPAHQAIVELVDHLQKRSRKVRARVEYESDPDRPGRTAIRITGETREAVQAEITLAMSACERENGFANFIGPHRIESGYGALGEVVIEPAVNVS